jgi:hypothetical protein
MRRHHLLPVFAVTAVILTACAAPLEAQLASTGQPISTVETDASVASANEAGQGLSESNIPNTAGESTATGPIAGDGDSSMQGEVKPNETATSGEPAPPDSATETSHEGSEVQGAETPPPSDPLASAPTSCAPAPTDAFGEAPSVTSVGGVGGTTTSDLQSFARTYNDIRVANCLPPIPYRNIRYDSCTETRLFWIAEDPSTDSASAWGHIGSVRSDGLASVGCDGNLAGGAADIGATVAQKWWDSAPHRASLYKPTFLGSTNGVCILFAMTHGGVPNEPYSFTRAAARWVNC